jgi:hypothetical protein
MQTFVGYALVLFYRFYKSIYMFVVLKERGSLAAEKQFSRFNMIQYKISARKDKK